MEYTDLESVINIRNDPDTYKFLHTPKTYTLEESQEWFKKTNPIWYMIVCDSVSVGYMRTSNWNYEDRSLWIGCDIDKQYRRRGIAFSAYTKFIDMLKNCHWNTVKLSVLKSNPNAYALYKKLGFKTFEELDDSYNMQLSLNTFANTRKGVKVIACYFGNRRFDSANHNPHDAKDVYDMLQFMWKMEQNEDQGYPHDVCFVHNELLPTDPVSNSENVQKCKDFLLNIDGKPTANGKAIVINRQNIGISFGAFDHAFNLLKENYDFWFFTEDDQVIVKENTFKNALKILHLPKTQANGYVATVGVNRSWGPGVNGGCGVTTREILQKVTETHFSGYLNRGSLPFYYNPSPANQSVQTVTMDHLWAGEVMFTKVIHDMGYYLEEHNDKDINMSWKDSRFDGRRTTRCRPYESWMDNNDLSYGDIKKQLIISEKQFHNSAMPDCNCPPNKVEAPWLKETINGSWIQDNGDRVVICNNSAVFNERLKGNIASTITHLEIHWSNSVVYRIRHTSIVENVQLLEIEDSGGTTFKIKKSPHN
jgi:RimJ/RimL family protein N-acetyltransferase